MKISVYIPSYNQLSYLKLAVHSVLNQTLRPFEILVIDDGSVDGSPQWVQQQMRTFPNLRLHVMEKNAGISAVRQQALKLLSGDYITYCDGDDLFENTKLEVEAGLVLKYQADLVFSNYYRITESEETTITGIWAHNLAAFPEAEKMDYAVFLRRLPERSLFRSELVRRSLIEEVGGYDPIINLYEDYELKIRLTSKAKMAFTLKPLSYYRNNPSGLSKINREEHRRVLEYIYEKHRNSFYNKYPDKKAAIELEMREFLQKVHPKEQNSVQKPRTRSMFARWKRN